MAESSDLFRFAQKTFDRLIGEFAAYGLVTRPRLELRQGTGLMCYSDLSDGNIYVSVPDRPDEEGKRQALFLRALTGCPDEARLHRFCQLLLPWGIAHELAHHYRREYGLFGESLWIEEQLANRLASAANKSRLSPEDEMELRSLLEQAIHNLSGQVATLDSAIVSADNLLQALNVSGEIPADRYMFFRLGWMYLDLCSRDQHYVDEFVRDGLQLTWPLLARIERPHSEPGDGEVRACFSAHHNTASTSESASRYFYKRYRTLLLHKMAAGTDAAVEREIGGVLEQSEHCDYETLDMASRFAPARLHGLFPRSIAREVLQPSEVESQLPCSTDRRLWLHVMMGKQDENAARTLKRMAILEQAPIFRPLPAETLLEMSHSMCRVLIREGDPIIREGRTNDDIYVLTKGRLSVSKRHGQAEVTVAFISPGEVFGEMAFLTRRPRSATLRAVEESECIMVKSADLRLLAYRQPSVILQVARVLAERLEVR